MSLVRPLSRTLTRPLIRPLIGGLGALSIDPDAAAYLSLVIAAGGTVTSVREAAINSWFRTAKESGYYSALGRMYLPIWGVTAANAICLVSGTSGTFVGGVTHGAGFVQGNGSTGYFDLGISPTSLGMTTSSGHLSGLVYVADTRPANTSAIIGSRTVGDVLIYQQGGALNFQGSLSRIPVSVFPVVTLSVLNGIVIINRKSATSLQVRARQSSGVTSGAVATTDVTGNAVSTVNLAGLCIMDGAVPAFLSDMKIGVLSAGTAINDDLEDVYTAHLKTLWETCTGLTLP